MKILLIGDNSAMIRLLNNPLTRKLSSLSMNTGTDIYRKLNAEADDFDLIVLQLPMPQSLYAERLYSVRFCQLLKDHLADDGILAVWLPEELLSCRKNYLSELYGSAGAVLSKVFPQVIPSSTLGLSITGVVVRPSSTRGLSLRRESTTIRYRHHRLRQLRMYR